MSNTFPPANAIVGMEDVTVASVTDVGPSTVALELETPSGFEALPGQFVLLRAQPDEAGEPVSRHYTLSRPPTDGTFEITVGVDPDGELAPWLATLEGGETVAIDGPYGGTTYEGGNDVVAVAGGPGIGPAVAIAEAAQGAGHGATVIYEDDEPAHRDRLEALEGEGATITLLDDGAETLDDHVATHLEDGQFYVFGFAGFIERVTAALEDAGGDPGDALMENFG